MPDRPVDPERPRVGNAFDQSGGFSGEDYHRDREAAEGRRDRAGTPAADGRDVPPDSGRRASIDEATGEVHGSGAGAGGGQPGEDFDQDAENGDGYPLTGSERGDSRPGDLGPAPSGR